MPGHLKLDRVLSDADRAEFIQFCARPSTTVRTACEWVKARGYKVGNHCVYSYLRRLHPERRSMQRFTKLEKMLKPEHRPLVEATLLHPSTTVESLHELVKKLGYEISRVSVWRDVRRWRQELMDIRRCSRFARALCQVAQDVGPSGFSGGAMLGLEQVVLEQVFQLRNDEKVGARDLTDWAAMLERTISVREQLETLRRKSDRAGKKAAPTPAAPGGAAAAPADKPRVVNGVEIANCVRRILGVPLPGEPVPDAPMLPAPPVTPRPPLPHASVPEISTEHTEATEHTEREESG